MADFTLQALHDEIEADPQTVGYKNGDGTWKGDAEIADLINDPVNGATITRKLIQRNEIIYGIEPGECVQTSSDVAPDGVFSDTERWWLSMILRDEIVDANDSEIFAGLLQLFPTEAERPGFRGTSRVNIQSTLQRQGSRAEILWGEGRTMSIGNVGHAANL
jgi:hypothetical protein